MSEHFLHTLLLIFGSAFFFLRLTRLLKISSTLGYLFAGIAIGPCGFGWITQLDQLRFLGEGGVLLLLFSIGLNLPGHRLKALRTYIFGLGAAQVLLTTILLAPFLKFFTPLPEPLIWIVATLLSFSSTALVAQILAEKHELLSHLGRVAISILLFQDVAVIVLLLLIPAGIQRAATLDFAMGEHVLLMCAAGLGIWLITRAAVVAFIRGQKQNSAETQVGAIFFFILSIAAVGHYFQLPTELGAIIAGLALAESPLRHKIETTIQPSQEILLGLFLIIIGVDLQPTVFQNHAVVILAATLGICVLKSILLVTVGSFFRLSRATLLQLSLLLAGGSEFVFVMAAQGTWLRTQIGPENTQILLAITTVSLLLIPFLGLLGEFLTRLSFFRKPSFTAYNAPLFGNNEPIIVAGWNDTGQLLAQLFDQTGTSYVICDSNPQKVTEAQEKNHRAFCKTLRDITLFHATDLEHTKALIITFPLSIADISLLTSFKKQFPNFEICATVDNFNSLGLLKKAGVQLCAAPHVETGLNLLHLALQAAGFPKDEAARIFEVFTNSLFALPQEA